MGLQGTEIPCTKCVSHAKYLAHGNGNGEARGRNRHKKNGKRGVTNLVKEKSPEQGPSIAFRT